MGKNMDRTKENKLCQIHHDMLLSMKPVIDRLDQIFKPDGKFDKLCDSVSKNSEAINSNQKQINWLWGLITGVIVTLVVLIITK